MPSNSLPDADLNLPEMKTKSPSCPAGGVQMYAFSKVSLLGGWKFSGSWDDVMITKFVRGVDILKLTR